MRNGGNGSMGAFGCAIMFCDYTHDPSTLESRTGRA